MFHEAVSRHQLAGWLLVAMSAPLVQTAGTGGWLIFLLSGAVCLGLCWLLHLLPTEHLLKNRGFCLLEAVWLTVLLAVLADWSVDAWPTGTDFPLVPFILLALAAAAALNGAAGASRVAGVLLWFLALLYGIVLAAGSKNVKPLWLLPRLEAPGAAGMLLLLLPAAAIFLPRQKGSVPCWLFPGLLLFGTAVNLWTVGTISPQVAGELFWPFYESSKSLSLFGVAERFEALVSVAMTLGYFGLYALLLSAVGYLMENSRKGSGKGGILAAAIGAGLLVLFAPEPHPGVLAVAAVLVTLLLPLLGGVKELCKKSKKDEKSY